MLKALGGALRRGVAAVGRGFSAIGSGLKWGIEKLDDAALWTYHYLDDAFEYAGEMIWNFAPVRGLRHLGHSLAGDHRPALAVQKPEAPEPEKTAEKAKAPRTAKVANFEPQMEEKKSLEPKAIHAYASAKTPEDRQLAALVMTKATREWCEKLEPEALEAIAAVQVQDVAAHLVGTKPIAGVPAKAVPAPAGLSPDLSKIANQSKKLYRQYANDAAQEQATKQSRKKAQEPTIDAHGPGLVAGLTKDMHETRSASQIVKEDHSGAKPQSLEEARARVERNRARSAEFSGSSGRHVPHLAMA